MKKILALSSLLFLLLAAVIPAGVTHAATSAVQLSGITIDLENGKEIKAVKTGDNQFSVNLVGNKAYGQQAIEKVIVESPNAKTISVFSKNDSEYIDELDLHFVDGKGVIDSTKYNNWMNWFFDTEGEEYEFTLDVVKTFFVPLATDDEVSKDDHKTAYNFVGFLADKDGNESQASLKVVSEDWEKVGNNWKFLGGSGEYLTGWQYIDNKWYYFGSDTIMVTGWKYIGDKWYFFNAGGDMEEHAVKSNGKLYVIDENGAMLTGTGWVKSGDTWYLLNGDVAKTGWVKSGNDWYYLDTTTGKMATGWVADHGTWYYMTNSGAMETGWVQDAGQWYYLATSGAMKTGWVNDRGTWYYLNTNGSMATGWALVNNKWYFLNESGAMKTGWVKDNNLWYYLDNSGAMKTGWIKVANVWYFLYNDGHMAANTTIGSYKIGNDGAWIQ